MSNSSFSYWCNLATSEIRYKPDRDMVYKELEQHMYERYDSYIAQGIDHKEATKMTMEAMGSATKVAAQLGDIHRPFWGYVLRACRNFIALLLVFGAIPMWKYFTTLDLKPNYLQDFDVYSAESYGEGSGRTLYHLSQPNVSFTSDGNTFKVTDAAVFSEVDNDGQTRTKLYFLIEQYSLLPAREHSDYENTFPVTNWFFVTDSEGRCYPAGFEQPNGADQLISYDIRTGIFSRTIECWISDFENEDAQWVDICYEREGRRYALHIDLTGGEAA